MRYMICRDVGCRIPVESQCAHQGVHTLDVGCEAVGGSYHCPECREATDAELVAARLRGDL